jgi:hypothetical protein
VLVGPAGLVGGCGSFVVGAEGAEGLGVATDVGCPGVELPDGPVGDTEMGPWGVPVGEPGPAGPTPLHGTDDEPRRTTVSWTVLAGSETTTWATNWTAPETAPQSAPVTVPRKM